MSEMSRGERIYEGLLRLYPPEFRTRFGRAMRDFHHDRVAMAHATGESISLLWLRTIADVITSATAERLRPLLSGASLMETLAQDLGYAIRGLRRRPAFTAIVVATIALGVGANAAIFSVVSGILLRPLPYPKPEQLFLFGHEPPTWLSSEPDFVDYHREMRSLSALAAYSPREVTLATGEAPLRIRIARGSDDFFPLLGVKPLLGRTFTADEFVPRISQAIVLSHSLWQRQFGGDRAIVGKKVIIEGAPRIVVGVMPPRFGFPEEHTEAWMPYPRINADSMSDRANHFLWMVGRLKDGITLDQAKAEARLVAAGIVRREPNKFDPSNPLRPTLTSVREQLVGNTKPYLLALLGAVGFVLLIACVNVTNLLLVHGESRRKEMALRSALGASEHRLSIQLLTESLLLSLSGAVIGLAIAWAAVRALVAAAPSGVPRVGEIGVDWRVLGFTAAIAVLTGIVVGLVPAWRGARTDPAETLKDGGKTAGSERSSKIARRSLVVAEMALAVTLLSGATMLLRSLWHLQSERIGFDARRVLTAKVSVSTREYDDMRTTQFFAQVLERIRALPGVRAAGAAGWLPVVDAGGLWSYRPEAGRYPEGRWPGAVPQQATPGYFAAIGIRIVEGREFLATDGADAELVAIVSRKFAEQAWPGTSALGRRFRLGGDTPLMRIVGVVDDIQSRGFGDKPEPTMYFPHAQTMKSAYFTPRSMSVLVRTDGDPRTLAEAIRRAVQQLDRSVPVSDIRTLEDVVGQSVAMRRFNTMLLAGFALLALVLAGIGTYGVIAYGVSQRTFEIGIRLALGAENRTVLALVMSEGLRLAAVGLLLGGAASLAVGKAIRAMLIGVGTIDAPSLIVTAVSLVVVAGAASVVPALRAARVNPLDAIRTN
jgi:putative ABC transport system permease protein